MNRGRDVDVALTAAPSRPAHDVGGRRRIAWAAALDITAVVVFVAVGRRSHDEGGNSVVEAVKVAAPFLIGLALGWLAARAWRSPLAWRTGAVVWVCTVAAGMLLRRFVFDRSTALAFVLVAAIALGILLNGWRAVGKTFRTGRGSQTAPRSGTNPAQNQRVSS